MLDSHQPLPLSRSEVCKNGQMTVRDNVFLPISRTFTSPRRKGTKIALPGRGPTAAHKHGDRSHDGEGHPSLDEARHLAVGTVPLTGWMDATASQRSYEVLHAAVTRRYVPILARAKLVNFDRPKQVEIDAPVHAPGIPRIAGRRRFRRCPGRELGHRSRTSGLDLR